ncbi:MAG: tyrosine-type recombinase/integrase, partial [Candidatus Thermoplasmatota archaeon]|nr:tyrosine-type recombinase/integrase [Candidatus Thermoplasmatota archaeon]
MKKNNIVSAEAGNSNLLPEQVKVLQNYHRDNVLNSLSEATCHNKMKDITLFARAVKKSFNQVTEEDIKSYLSELSKRVQDNTLSVKKSAIKSFFKWFYKTDDYPVIVRWIKTGYAKSKHRMPESILTPDDIKALINSAKTVQHKAIIAALYDTGVRIGEFLNMNINDIQYDENGAFIFVNGKTGQRMVRFIHSQKYLSTWLEYHPYKDKIKTNKLAKYPLWVSDSTCSKGQRLSQSGISGIIHYIADRTSINKKISPHQFRHARLTDLAKKGINEPALKMIAGWVGNSNMPEIYIHLSGRDGVNQLLEAEKNGYVKPNDVDNPLRPVECPRCKFENGSALHYCGQCGMPLDETILIKTTNSFNEILNDPLAVLYGLKEAYEN